MKVICPSRKADVTLVLVHLEISSPKQSKNPLCDKVLKDADLAGHKPGSSLCQGLVLGEKKMAKLATSLGSIVKEREVLLLDKEKKA